MSWNPDIHKLITVDDIVNKVLKLPEEEIEKRITNVLNTVNL